MNGIPVINSGSFSTGLAVADVWRRADGTREIRTKLHTVWADSIRPDAALAALVTRARQQTERVASRPVTDLKFPLPKRDGEYALGHLIADAQRAAARADVAIMNNGGIRVSLPAGTVTYGQLYEVQPFDNRIVTLTIRGDSLLRAFEFIVAAEIDANVSGVELSYNPTRREGQRVTRARLSDGREVRRNESYTLAVNDFMAEGGSGFSMLKGARVEPVGLTDLEALVNYLQRLPKPVEIPATTRIRAER
jgi:5'-nucleotidase